MPARLRIRLRPPSHPPRYFARSDVLGKVRHLTSAIDRDPQLVDPGGEDAFDMALPQREPVVVAGWKVADVQTVQREAGDLHHLPLRKESLGDATLIEHLDRA